MATNFDSFDRSPLDAFYQSPLFARGVPPVVKGALLRGFQRNDQPYGTFLSEGFSQDFHPRVGKTWSTLGTNRTKRYRIICEFTAMASFPYNAPTLNINCSLSPPVVTTLESFILNVFLVVGNTDFYNFSTLLATYPSSAFVVGTNTFTLNNAILSGMAGQPSLYLLLATDLELAGAGGDPFAAKKSSMLGREDAFVGFSAWIASG